MARATPKLAGPPPPHLQGREIPFARWWHDDRSSARMLTAIADRAGRSFPRHAHTNGFASWKSGAVTIEQETPTSVTAKVRGQRTRDVTFEDEKGRLVVSCSCPSRTFELPGCKHAWATLLEIDRRGALPNLRGTRAPLPVSFLEPVGGPASDRTDEDEDAAAPDAVTPTEKREKEKKKRGRAAKADAEAKAAVDVTASGDADVTPEDAPKKKKASKKKVDAGVVTKTRGKESSPASGPALRRSARATSVRPEGRGKQQRGRPRASKLRR